ncbi:hypothetical protein JTE90_022509 [Oedothorax gibbosus]|uniref:Uncharacterized protein n=1 Tax=Oedothorax gibbosus TaxID=931172 RepID=A0AAV6UZC9_9ARAC|nr:hypothetical protein JTE90_022509 [Oedothorax gibbosus]
MKDRFTTSSDVTLQPPRYNQHGKKSYNASISSKHSQRLKKNIGKRAKSDAFAELSAANASTGNQFIGRKWTRLLG